MKERIATGELALRTLEELLDRDLSDPVVRDALIKRFEYTYEATIKAAQAEFTRRGLPLVGPKVIARESFRAGFLSEADAEAALDMVNDRNASVHTYDEELAAVIASRIPRHAGLLARWLDGLGKAPP